jgi:hypothetical protein
MAIQIPARIARGKCVLKVSLISFQIELFIISAKLLK